MSDLVDLTQLTGSWKEKIPKPIFYQVEQSYRWLCFVVLRPMFISLFLHSILYCIFTQYFTLHPAAPQDLNP